MKDTFFYTLHAILPILLIILLGLGIRLTGWWSDDFFKQVNSLCFRLFLPVQLFCSVYSIDDLSSVNWRMVCYLFFSVFLCLAVGLTPLTELCWQAGCEMAWIRELSGHVPIVDENLETSVPGLYAAGEIVFGLHGNDTIQGSPIGWALISGRLAAESILATQ